MSTGRTRASRHTTRWVRLLGSVVTVGLFATVGVSLGRYGQRAVADLATWFDGSPVVIDPGSAAVFVALVHDVSVLLGVVAVVGGWWLGLVLAVRVVFGLRASV